MAGETGTRSAVSDSIMDIAVPLDKNGDGAVDYIVYIADNKREISDLSWRFFQIVIRPMMFKAAGGDPAVLPAQQDHHHADRAHH